MKRAIADGSACAPSKEAEEETGEVAKPAIVDAHCHLDAFEDREEAVERARAAGLVHLVVNGLWRGAGDFGCALDLARADRSLFSATVAIHPHDVAQAPRGDFDAVERLARDAAIAAIGETGLDYHYNLSPPGLQREGLRWHLRLAREVKKPIVLHIREAHEDALNLFREEGSVGMPTQIHCFTGGPSEARAWLDVGGHISFSGALTFRNGDAIREAARLVPLDRLLVETDSPYLAPVPHRGKRCEPAFVLETLRCLAKIKGLPIEEMAVHTSANAARLFGFALPESI